MKIKNVALIVALCVLGSVRGMCINPWNKPNEEYRSCFTEHKRSIFGGLFYVRDYQLNLKRNIAQDKIALNFMAAPKGPGSFYVPEKARGVLEEYTKRPYEKGKGKALYTDHRYFGFNPLHLHVCDDKPERKLSSEEINLCEGFQKKPINDTNDIGYNAKVKEVETHNKSQLSKVKEFLSKEWLLQVESIEGGSGSMKIKDIIYLSRIIRKDNHERYNNIFYSINQLRALHNKLVDPEVAQDLIEQIGFEFESIMERRSFSPQKAQESINSVWKSVLDAQAEQVRKSAIN